MPLDPRIPMGFRQPEFANPLDMALKGGKLAALMQQMEQSQATDELNQLKLGQLRESIARGRSLKATLEGLRPEDMSDRNRLTSLLLPHLEPKDAIGMITKDPMQGMPDIAKLQNLEQKYRAAGGLFTPLADQVAAQIKKLGATETSASQENMAFLLDVQNKARTGAPVNPQDMAKATLIYKSMTAPRFDAASGQTLTPNLGQQFDPERFFGITQRTAAPTDEAALQQVRDATARGINATVGVAPGAPAPASIAALEPRMQVQQVAPAKPATRIGKLNADLDSGLITPAQFNDEMRRLAASDAGKADDAIINAIVAGRMQLPSGFALRSPYWQDVINRVAMKDPNFDATKYGARAAARRTFASGPEARNVTALNTVIGHLGTLDDAATALQNNDVRAVNAVVNRIQQELGDPRITSFDTARQAVAEETMRVFRQVGASEQEARDWRDRISSSGSPAQLRANVSTLGELLESRIDAIARQYERTVQEQGNPASVDPKNRAVLNRLTGKDQQQTTGALPKFDKDGWTLHIDSKGNKAYVSPDKKQFREVK